ncbi:MAG: chromate transporter [Firmicutes bacterium]|nr:chromate transporter [Bacillota bacterium]
MDHSVIKKSLKLFIVFLKIGAFTFGGGYAMIPFIEKEIVEKNEWIKSEDIVDIFAIIQSVPGVIAVNSSTFVGYRVAGIAGALAATLGVILPSFVVISVIALFLYDFKNYPYITEAFNGIRAGVTALMVSVVIKLGKSSVKGTIPLIIAIAAFLSLTFFGVEAIPVLIIAGISGLVITTFRNNKIQMNNDKGNNDDTN